MKTDFRQWIALLLAAQQLLQVLVFLLLGGSRTLLWWIVAGIFLLLPFGIGVLVLQRRISAVLSGISFFLASPGVFLAFSFVHWGIVLTLLTLAVCSFALVLMHAAWFVAVGVEEKWGFAFLEFISLILTDGILALYFAAMADFGHAFESSTGYPFRTGLLVYGAFFFVPLLVGSCVAFVIRFLRSRHRRIVAERPEDGIFENKTEECEK